MCVCERVKNYTQPITLFLSDFNIAWNENLIDYNLHVMRCDALVPEVSHGEHSFLYCVYDNMNLDYY